MEREEDESKHNGGTTKRSTEQELNNNTKMVKLEKSDDAVVKLEQTVKDEPPKICNKDSIKEPSVKKMCLNLNNKDVEIGSDYNPAKLNYHPIKDAYWDKNMR